MENPEAIETAMETIPNILAERYASSEMQEIWSTKNRIVEERKLWVEILKAQKDLSVDIESETIEAYEKVINKVDIDSIKEREKVLRHDVMARIEEFSALANREQIHLGLTSRDITENIEQRLMCSSLVVIREKAWLSLEHLCGLAKEYKSQPMVARTHNIPAQVTTLGRRFAVLGEELLNAIVGLSSFLNEYKFRGIKGAVGTQSDLLELFQGKEEKVKELDRRVAKYLGEDIPGVSNQGESLVAVGQIYPRSLDLAFAHCLVQLATSPANFAINLRILSGFGLANEAQSSNQVGSSAMPHKVNPSVSERISGLNILIKSYMSMLSELSGNQWNEGDVSCSVVRRVALPNICFASDAIFRNYLSVLKNLWIDAQAMSAEVNQQLPFLGTSRILIAAVKAGMGREVAHEIIREQSSLAKTALLEPQGESGEPFLLSDHPLVKGLVNSKKFALSEPDILKAIHTDPLWGRAETQVDEFLDKVSTSAKNKAK